MAKRLTPRTDNGIGEESPASPVELSLEDTLAPDGMPNVFCDVDIELKRAPRLFAGFDELKPEDVLGENDTLSKSQGVRAWQYKRWLTWKHLKSQSLDTILVHREESEDEKARGTASINGVTYYIIKELYLKVPHDIAQLIATSQGETMQAGQSELISSLPKKIDPVTGAPKDPSRLE